MVTGETTVRNKTGLHARPAAMFSAEVGKFLSKITVKNVTADSQEVNAKSIMRILTLAMGQGTRIQIRAEGEDEEEALKRLMDLVDSCFGEE